MSPLTVTVTVAAPASNEQLGALCAAAVAAAPIVTTPARMATAFVCISFPPGQISQPVKVSSGSGSASSAGRPVRSSRSRAKPVGVEDDVVTPLRREAVERRAPR